MEGGNEMSEKVRKFIHDRTIEFLRNRSPRHLIFKTFPGSGKTTETMRAIDESGAKWIYAAPRHEVIDENILASPHRYYDFVHLKSKEKMCLNKDARIMFTRGYDVSFICKECPHLGVCPYMESQRKVRNELPNIAIVHSHLGTWLPAFLDMKYGDIRVRDEYNVLIIDESPLDTMFEQTSVSHSLLSTIRWNILNCGSYDKAFYDILGLLQMNPIPFDDIMQLVPDLYTGKKRRRFLERYAKFLYNGVKDGTIRNLHRNVLRDIYRAIDYAYTEEKMRRAFRWKRNELYIYTFITDLISSLGMRVIALDGTASEEAWSNIIGSNDIEVVPAKYYHENAYQLNEYKLPISTWKSWLKNGNSPGFKRYLELLRLIAQRRNGNVLYIATKEIISMLERELGDLDNVEFAHYYALRSKNAYYERCDTVVLVCEPNPEISAIPIASTLSGWDRRIFENIYTRDEMVQAVGRLRANIKITAEGRQRVDPTVFILPNTGVGRGGTYSTLLPEAIVVSYNTLVDILNGERYTGDIAIMKEFLEALPISANQFSKQYGVSYYKINKIVKYLYRNNYVRKEGSRYIKGERAPETLGTVRLERHDIVRSIERSEPGGSVRSGEKI